ncbi:PREDICTED: SH3 domain-binding protein 5-like [Dipodomys ordii]|uniref:SH3 domain-binding protein 5 n=1 Tax=Dipodomys ordii TaxID=10020 RepID=A0A1S3GW74_DIPOR|nr:PREDICTED: SH3 domain-binding protein 5-like [Dipodomys ordii]
MEAEQTKTRSELVHKETAARYNAAIGRMRQLEKKLKRAINKSKPYFELKGKYYVQLEVCMCGLRCIAHGFFYTQLTFLG